MSAIWFNIIGFIVIFHAAYSANQYKSLSNLSNTEFSGNLPLDVLIECVVAFAVIAFGQLSNVKFRNATISNDQRWTSMGNKIFHLFL